MNAQVHYLQTRRALPTTMRELKSGLGAHAQGIWSLDSKRLAGFEFLARARLSDGQQWSPTEFVPLAESWNWLNELTLRVVDQMLSCLAQLQLSAERAMVYSFNVTPNQIMDAEFLDRLIRRLSVMDAPLRSQLVVEVTEAAAEQSQGLREAVRHLQESGLTVALDDFGCEHANFARLAETPWDIIKLDRDLIDRIPENRRARTIVRSALSLARELGAISIAEGVESNRQRTWLAAAGCELAQGFLWSPPVSLSRVVAALGRS